jgi:hypothetical protein
MIPKFILTRVILTLSFFLYNEKKPYISSPFGWGLDGGSKRIYRAINPS